MGTNKTLGSNSKGLGFPHPSDVGRHLAFQMAEKNGFAHKFNIQKQKAGQDRLDGFLRRNKDISFRKPESNSASRALAFN